MFSRKNLPRIKNRAYTINVNDKNSKGTHWFSSFIDRGRDADFDSFGIEYIPREILNKCKYKSITHNIFRIQDSESVICGIYCITFIEYRFSRLLDYTNLFSPNNNK